MSPALERLDADERTKLTRAKRPKRFTPMKATLTDERFSDERWIFERKLDGVRAIAFRGAGEAYLRSRTDNLLDDSYPELIEGLERQPCTDFVADGEIVAFSHGVTSFSRLQGRMQISDPDKARRSGIAVYLYLFDLVHVEGTDITGLPLRTRKALLREVISAEDPIRLLGHRNRDGEDAYREACERGLEGVIAKRAEGTYSPKRTRDWLKFKCANEQELVIGGFTEPQGSRTNFGALLVGYFENGDLRYAGKVGTGFDEETLSDLGARLRKLEREEPPFADVHPAPKRTHWVSPKLVGQFGFTEWTRDGRLRHPRYLGLRDDKKPREVVRERPS